MSSVVKTVFGGSDDSSQKAQTKSNEDTQAFVEEQARIARGDVLALAPVADVNRNLGVQGALDVLGQSVPAQVGALFRAEGQAQRNLLGGLTQFERSILGNPGNITSGLGGQPLAPDLAFTRQTLPQFTSSQEALAPAPPPVAGAFAPQIPTGLFGHLSGDNTLATIQQRVDAAFGQGTFDTVVGEVG